MSSINCKKYKQRAKTLKDLATEYGVSEDIFRKWIEPFKDEIGKRVGFFYTPKQIRIIYERLDTP